MKHLILIFIIPLLLFTLSIHSVLAENNKLQHLIEQLKKPTPEAEIPYEDQMQSQFGDGPASHKDRIIMLIANYGEEAAPAVPVLLEVYNEEGPPILSCWEEGEHRLCEGFGNLSYKTSVLEALGQIGKGATEALAFLTQLIINPEDTHIRDTAFETFTKITTPHDENFSLILAHLTETKNKDDDFNESILKFIATTPDKNDAVKKYLLHLVQNYSYLPIDQMSAAIIAKFYNDDEELSAAVFERTSKDHSKSTPYAQILQHLKMNDASQNNPLITEFNATLERLSGRSINSSDRTYLETIGNKILQNFNDEFVQQIDVELLAIYLSKGGASKPHDSVKTTLKIAAKLGEKSAPLVPILDKKIARNDYRYDNYNDLAVAVLMAINNEEANIVLERCMAIEANRYGSCK